tara:strand:- start:800 stop:2389 length:1590 start_codon:yes stop_codon:yes gene_type:complete
VNDFLSNFFSEMPEEGHALVWHLETKRSYWPTTAAAASSMALALERDVYLGVGFAPKDYGPNKRCPASEIAGIRGFWADIDIADPLHKKTNLPPTQKDALRIIEDLPKPTWVIHSGHGLQCWWFFNEPWIFEDDADREKAASMSRRWNDTIRFQAKKKGGWTVDATHDLARVMRIPGTVNAKDPDNPVPATILQQSSLTYDPSEFDEFVAEEVETRVTAHNGNHSFILHPEAFAPPSKLAALLLNDAKFKKTWERKRKDLEDGSPSAYDLSLMTQVLSIGWEPQEAVNLCIQGRALHGDELKLREDYYSRTLTKALADNTLTEQPKKKEPATPEEGIQAIATALDAPIIRLIGYGDNPGTYYVKLPDREVLIGGIDNLLSQTKFRAALADATKRVPPLFKPAKWRAILNKLLEGMEQRDPGDSDRNVETVGLMRGYLDHSSPRDADRDPSLLHEALTMHEPFIKGGEIWIYINKCNRWMISKDPKSTDAEIRTRLRGLGTSCKTFTARNPDTGKNICRYYWQLNLPRED